MKCIFIVLLLTIGLQCYNAEDEATEPASDNTESPIKVKRKNRKQSKV